MQAKNIKESRVQECPVAVCARRVQERCNIKYSVDLKNGYLSAAYL